VSVPVGRRSVAPKPPDLHRLASYNRGGGRSRRRLPVLPILLILLLLAVGAGGFVLGRLTAPETEVVASPQSPGTTVPVATSSTVPVPVTAAVIHEIKQGENLQKIADLYGVTQEQLIAFNEITDPNKIFWGLRLRIPPADYVPPTTMAPSTTLAP
jgi:hypothetical protein